MTDRPSSVPKYKGQHTCLEHTPEGHGKQLPKDKLTARSREINGNCKFSHVTSHIQSILDFIIECANIQNFDYKSNSLCYSIRIRFENSLLEVVE